LIGAVLSTAGECHVSAGRNGYSEVVASVLKITPTTRFCVQELSGSAPGSLAPQIKLLQPHIGIITAIGTDHYKRFRSQEATAQEKGQLFERLTKEGTAIVNIDDPYVRSLIGRTAARLLTIGTTANADVRAEAVASRWPERLSLTVCYRGERIHVQTRLVGEWWTTSVLAAIACGVICGLDLKACAQAIENFETSFGRYSVHEVPGAATYILDHKAPFWTVAESIDFIGAARAVRKTIVLGTVSDYAGASSPRYRRLAREALALSDRVLFVGPQAMHASRLAAGWAQGRLFCFPTTFHASEFLKEQTLQGELILIKGSMATDHLERIFLSQLDRVVCWRSSCGKSNACPDCRKYRRPFAAEAGRPNSNPVNQT
jgi:UDP-N-acetylmuramoyl-tripeptide--D-alanyl-D-alanine ligase